MLGMRPELAGFQLIRLNPCPDFCFSAAGTAKKTCLFQQFDPKAM